MVTLLVILQVFYYLVVLSVCLRIIYDTQSFSKTLAYLLLVVLVPIFGIIFYLSFGINYRKRRMYSKKLIADDEHSKALKKELLAYFEEAFQTAKSSLRSYQRLINMLTTDTISSVSANNTVELLFNGENKFPKVLESLKNARHHIHIEYYIFEDDNIGNQVVDLLIQKAQEGVEVRFIYDAYGSKGIRRKTLRRLKRAGVQASPFHRILFIFLANRLNYRNHRKIIVVDGREAYIGGINVSDKYINDPVKNNKMYWRDTHLCIRGHAVYVLQYTFLCDWNFCTNDTLGPNSAYFPPPQSFNVDKNKVVQIAASGPDSVRPNILYSLLQVIGLAKKEVLITTPYFIPSESILDALIVAALGGVKVKLLVPGVSDSKFVNAAARSYYKDLLYAGVEIYTYQKGFVHAKTIVVDRNIGIVGTANMDYRSFDLNFEINAIVYDEGVASELSEAFYTDIESANLIHPEEWFRRSKRIQLIEKSARLVSPLL